MIYEIHEFAPVRMYVFARIAGVFGPQFSVVSIPIFFFVWTLSFEHFSVGRLRYSEFCCN